MVMQITNSEPTECFQPFSVTIQFDTADEAMSLLAYLNRAEAEVSKEEFNFKKFVSMTKVFENINTILRKQGIIAW